MQPRRATKARAWLDDRLGLEPLWKLVKEKEIPLHRHTIWYYFGGMALFLFVVQVITGSLLLLYYRPSQEAEYGMDPPLRVPSGSGRFQTRLLARAENTLYKGTQIKVRYQP